MLVSDLFQCHFRFKYDDLRYININEQVIIINKLWKLFSNSIIHHYFELCIDNTNTQIYIGSQWVSTQNSVSIPYLEFLMKLI